MPTSPPEGAAINFSGTVRIVCVTVKVTAIMLLLFPVQTLNRPDNSGMNQPLSHASSLLRGGHFNRTVIMLCVRWYITYTHRSIVNRLMSSKWLSRYLHQSLRL